MPDPQQAVNQSDWDAAKPISQSDWDSAKPVGAGVSKTPPSAFDLVLTAAKQFASNFNPIAIGKGLYDAAQEHPAVAALASPLGAEVYEGAKQQYQKAKEAYQQGRYSEMAGHTLAMALPLVGPMAANAGEEIGSGDPTTMARGAGDAVAALAAPKITDAAIGKAAEALPAIKATMAARQMAKAPLRIDKFAADLPMAIPPSNATPYSPIDTARAAPYLAAEHAATPVSTVQHVTEAADSAISQIEDHIGQYIAANPQLRLQTDPVAAAASKMQSVRADFAALGQKELAHYPGLANPNDLTLAQADEIRDQLNAENKVALKKNQYEVASALKTDPAFAARYYAAQALRDGIYDGLEAQGIQGVRELRLDEGSLIKIRNAAQRQYFAGQRKVGGTGANGPVAQLARRTVPAAAAAVGAEVAGPAGAATADILGRTATNAMLPGNLTRDALVEKAFNRLGLQKPPIYPSIPPTQAPAGLLTAPATPLGQIPLRPSGPSATAPVVGGTSQPAVFGNRLQLPAGTANGELTRSNLAPSPLRTQSQMQVLEARPILVRDPATGRFKRIYTAEPKGGGS